MRSLLLVWLVAVTAGAAAVSVGPASGTGEGSCAPRWRVVANANVPQLRSLAALSPTNVWALGREEAGKAAVVVHWNGRTLRSFKPLQRSARYGQLSGIAAVASDDVWAVGRESAPWPQPRSAMIVHWDGRSWSEQAVPEMPANSWLEDIVAISREDVWTVGGSFGVPQQPLVMHWDGRSWSIQPTPVVSIEDDFPFLSAIDATSASDVWALGDREQHRHGGRPAPGHALERADVDGAPAARNRRGIERHFYHARTPEDIWMLEAIVDAQVDWGHRLIQSDGRRAHAHNYYMPRVTLSAIAAASKRSAWIVGGRLSGDGNRGLGPLVIRWHDGKLRIQHTPFESFQEAALSDIQILSPKEIWAAGPHLLARYSC
jgi:hypothetical protein